ncbi:MAG: hypothetical protein Q4P30_03460 [Eubacteriales bacterium]|nr:hypothetical protein [Eubacteriales bacterium]
MKRRRWLKSLALALVLVLMTVPVLNYRQILGVDAEDAPFGTQTVNGVTVEDVNKVLPDGAKLSIVPITENDADYATYRNVLGYKVGGDDILKMCKFAILDAQQQPVSLTAGQSVKITFDVPAEIDMEGQIDDLKVYGYLKADEYFDDMYPEKDAVTRTAYVPELEKLDYPVFAMVGKKPKPANDLADVKPVITPVNPMPTENEAVAGAKLATLSVPADVDTTDLTYEFVDPDNVLSSYEQFFEIVDNEIRIRADLDTAALPSDVQDKFAINPYTDGKKRLKQDEDFYVRVVAKRSNGAVSQDTANYVGNYENVMFVIGKYDPNGPGTQAPAVNLADKAPIITPVDPAVAENDAKAGAVLATLSMPTDVDTTDLTYSFADDPDLKKYTHFLEIVGNEVRINAKLDEMDIPSDYKDMFAINTYNDPTPVRRFIEGQRFYIKIQAKKGDQVSKVAANYNETDWMPNIIIGPHVYDPSAAANPFTVTKLSYYLGDKAIADVADDEWVAFADTEIEKINSTDGIAGKFPTGFDNNNVVAFTELGVKEAKAKKLYLRAEANEADVIFYDGKNKALTMDVTYKMGTSSDGDDAVDVKSNSLIRGETDTFWRSFNIKLYCNHGPFGHQESRFGVAAEAEDDVFPLGTKLAVRPIIAGEREGIISQLGDKAKGSTPDAQMKIDPWEISFLDRATNQPVDIAAGKTVKLIINVPEKIKDDSLKLYHLENGTVTEVPYTIESAATGTVRHMIANVEKVGIYTVVAEQDFDTPAVSLVDVEPIITPVTVAENDATAGAVLATLSMPANVDTADLTYEFVNDVQGLEKYTKYLVIEGNEVKIRSDFDEMTIPSDDRGMFATNTYNDPTPKNRFKEELSLFFKVRAKKGSEVSKSKLCYDEKTYKSLIVIGAHVFDPAAAKNPFKVTKLSYYLGNKKLADLTDDDWKQFAQSELDKINSTDGIGGHKPDEAIIGETDRSVKEGLVLNMFLRAETDEADVTFLAGNGKDIDISDKSGDGGDAITFNSTSLIRGTGADTFYRSFDIRLLTKLDDFGHQVGTDGIEAEAEAGVLPGVKLEVTPIVGTQYHDIKAELGARIDSNKQYNIRMHDVKLIDRRTDEEAEIPAGETIKLFFPILEKIKMDTLKVYHLHDGKIDELTGTIEHSATGTISYFVTAVSDLSPFVMIGEVAEEEEPPAAEVDKAALMKAISDAEAKQAEEGYEDNTEASKQALADALAAGKAVNEKEDATQKDVDDATKAINDAIAGLTTEEPPAVEVDKAALTKAISDAEAKQAEEGYADNTEVSKKALADALAAGKAVNEKADATQKDVDDAAKAINDAIAGLTKEEAPAGLDYTNLDAAIQSANDTMATATYPNATDASKKVLEGALAKGKALKNKTDATQKELDNAAKAIIAAIEGLEGKGDTKALEDLVEKATELTGDGSTDDGAISPGRRTALSEAINKANELIENGGTTDEIADAATKLQAAMDALNEPTDEEVSDLEKLIEKAEELQKTAKNPKELEEAVKAAKAALEKDPKSYKEVKVATDALQKAIKNADPENKGGSQNASQDKGGKTLPGTGATLFVFVPMLLFFCFIGAYLTIFKRKED